MRHILVAEPVSWLRLGWAPVLEPLHDALIKDALDRAAVAAGDAAQARWSPQVRALRAVARWLQPRRATPGQRRVGVSCAGVLGVVGALHVVWAAGSPWPLPDRESFVAAVMGAGQSPMGSDRFPPPVASLAVAGLLGVAATATASPRTPVRRILALGTAGVLALRGVAGLLGDRTIWRTAPEFARRDAALYSPLCLTLAAGIAWSLRPRAQRRPERPAHPHPRR